MYSILMPSQMPSGMWHQAVAVVVSLWTCSLSPAALLAAGLFLVLQTLGLRRATAAMRREESVAAGERTHGKRHQADIRFGHRRWTERQLYEVKLTPNCNWAISLLNDCSTVVQTGGTER